MIKVHQIIVTILKLSVLSCALIVTTASYSQSNDDEQEDDLVVERPRIPDAPSSRGSDANSNDDPSDQVFKPTEEISEDLPVPFPVDI